MLGTKKGLLWLADGQFRSAALAVSPPQLLLNPSILALGVEGSWRDSLDVVLALLSSSQSIDAIPVLFHLQVKSAALYCLLWGKLTETQPDPVQKP